MVYVIISYYQWDWEGVDDMEGAWCNMYRWLRNAPAIWTQTDV